MTERKYSYYSQPYAKTRVQVLLSSSLLLFLGSSGFYHIHKLLDIAKLYNVSYNTLRSDLKQFHREGWIAFHGKYFRFRTLEDEAKSWFKLYTNFYREIMQSDNPAIAFCNRVIISVKTYNYLQRQAIEESKNYDRRSARKYLRTVRGTNTPLGVNENLFFSLRSIGKQLGKSHVTVWRYLNRGVKDKLVRIKKNVEVIGDFITYDKARQEIGLRNIYEKSFIRVVDGKFRVFERKQNTLFLHDRKCNIHTPHSFSLFVYTNAVAVLKKGGGAVYRVLVLEAC